MSFLGCYGLVMLCLYIASHPRKSYAHARLYGSLSRCILPSMFFHRYLLSGTHAYVSREPGSLN